VDPTEIVQAHARTCYMMERLQEEMQKKGIAFTVENVIALLQRKGYRVNEQVIRNYCEEPPKDKE
jgi:hypothetical protein